MKNLYFLLAGLIFTGCSLDYSDSNMAEKLSENIPNTIIYKYETIEIQKGSPVMQIKAQKAEVYNSKEETYLTDVEFNNYKDNKITTSGKSTHAVLHMKSGDAEINGSIEIISNEDESFLKAESLLWRDRDKTLSSNLQDSVTVVDKNGSKLDGFGFSAEIKRKTIFFKNEIKGEFISNDEN